MWREAHKGLIKSSPSLNSQVKADKQHNRPTVDQTDRIDKIKENYMDIKQSRLSKLKKNNLINNTITVVTSFINHALIQT